MPRHLQIDKVELVYGTLGLLVLRALPWSPTHGHGIAKSIERMSDDVLRVDHGSLYPTLQRLLQQVGSNRKGAFPRRSSELNITASLRPGGSWSLRRHGGSGSCEL
jgi:hypothetical protein